MRDVGFREPVLLEELPVTSALGKGVLKAQIVEGHSLVLEAEVGQLVTEAVSSYPGDTTVTVGEAERGA